jgi:hypothetical protein
MLRFVAEAVTRLRAEVAQGTGFPTPQGHAILADENFYENMYGIFYFLRWHREQGFPRRRDMQYWQMKIFMKICMEFSIFQN